MTANPRTLDPELPHAAAATARSGREPDVVERARASRGTSSDAIYGLVARALRERHPGGGALLDVGCGTGNLWSHVRDQFDRYLGADVVRYEGFPDDGRFCPVNLEAGGVPCPDGQADVVAAVEVIEHVENPRAGPGVGAADPARRPDPRDHAQPAQPAEQVDAGGEEPVQRLSGRPRLIPGAPDGLAGDRPAADRPRVWAG